MKRFFTLLNLVFLSVVAMAQLGDPVDFKDIQFVSEQELAKGNDEPAKYGDGRNGGTRQTIVVEGVVCQMHPGFYGLSATSRKSTIVFSKDGSGRWTGLEVMADPGAAGADDLAALLASTKFYENFTPGLTVKMEGELGDYQGNTQLLLTTAETEVTSLTKTEIKPTVLPIDSFKNSSEEDQFITGEPFEHTYVEFQNVTVVNRNEWSTGRWNWSIKDANGLVLNIRDFSGYFRGDANTDSTIANQSTWEPPAEGTVLEYIRGVIVQDTRSGYQLAPLVPSDIGFGDVVPAVISGISFAPTVPSSSDDITVSATIVDDGSVASATIYYALGINSTDWKTVAMTNDNGDDWSGDIPKQADGSLIKYYIEATDNENNKSYGPDQTGLSSIIKVIDGGLSFIKDIQTTPLSNGESIYKDLTLEDIKLTGIVMSTNSYLGLTAIQDGTDPHSGIFIETQAGDGLSQLKRGDILTVTQATIEEAFGVTQLTNITFTKQDGDAVYDPILDLSIDSFQSNTAYAESYEGMLLGWEKVVVADTTPDLPSYFGEWTFAKAVEDEAQLRVDDLSPWIEQNFAHDTLTQGQELDYVYGMMYYSFGNWKLLPRDKNDIAGYFTPYPESVEEINAYINLQVFPNPANSKLNISFDLPKGDDRAIIEVLDLTGKVILSENMSDGQMSLDVSALEGGAYLLKISSEEINTAYMFTKN